METIIAVCRSFLARTGSAFQDVGNATKSPIVLTVQTNRTAVIMRYCRFAQLP